ncbi:hypothetical protein K9M41_02825 [Candidatus Gracilibacteria bacterium]|nr:hypothetical protein [Candidatus Gracilibacteria bacterium]
MKKTCPISGREFKLRPEDLQFYEQMDVPVPDIHPDEILRKLMALRNEWKLYKRKCDKTGDSIISAYHEDVPFPVYKNAIWWGDSWDGTDYGKEFDFAKPFFAQFFSLRDRVPREGTSVFNSENCDYNSHVRESKNCYLCSRTYRVEDCFHASWLVNDKNIVDSWRMIDSELCYECINSYNCFDCVMVQEGINCNECYFSYQLTGCDHCIGCNNLYRKSYHVFNKKVSKEEFEKIKKQIFDGSHKTWEHGLEYFQKMWRGAVHRFVHNLKCENVTGDLLKNCKNCWHSFDGVESEDCAYNVAVDRSKNIFHCFSTGWPGCELSYFSAVIRGSQDIRFSYYIWFSNNLTYCDSCVSCQDCFGCVGLKHKKYCIFNKQYSREEYLVLRDKIIQYMKDTGEWGTLPSEFSTFAYNESAAANYFPLEKSEAENLEFRWLEQKKPGDIPTEEFSVPESIHDVDNDILTKILKCEQTGKSYKIEKGELEFYRKMNIPIPRVCPEERINRRRKQRNKYHLIERKCDNCKKGILSTFAEDRSEKVFCEECYLATVE